VLRDGANGLSVDFFDHQKVATLIETALAKREVMLPLRAAARATAAAQFDLERLILPRWNRLFDDLINHRQPVHAT